MMKHHERGHLIVSTGFGLVDLNQPDIFFLRILSASCWTQSDRDLVGWSRSGWLFGRNNRLRWAFPNRQRKPPFLVTQSRQRRKFSIWIGVGCFCFFSFSNPNSFQTPGGGFSRLNNWVLSTSPTCLPRNFEQKISSRTLSGELAEEFTHHRIDHSALRAYRESYRIRNSD